MPRALGLGLLVLSFCCCGVHGESVWPQKTWEVATPDSQGMNAEQLDKARAWLESHKSKSGLVVRHGRVVAEWYFAGANPQTKFAAYSTSKSLSSIATGLAIADGKLSLGDTVGQFLPDAAPESKRLITVKHLLSMSSGVHNDPGIGQREDLFSFAIKTAAMDHEPGAKWNYNNTGLALLSPVFHKATGREIDEVLNERIFQPIGILQDDWKWEKRDGHTIPYSGFHTTARNMARIGLLALHEGKWQDKQLVPEGWIRESVAPSQELNKSYGYLWWNNTSNRWPGSPTDAFAALGKWDNNIFVVPSLDLVIIRQSDLAPEKGHQIAEYLKLVCDAAKPQ